MTRGRAVLEGGQKFCFSHVKFEMSIRYENEDAE